MDIFPIFKKKFQKYFLTHIHYFGDCPPIYGKYDRGVGRGDTPLLPHI